MTEPATNITGSAASGVLAVIRNRRSISSFLPDPLPARVLEEALDAGRFAPNHKLTEPWRFTIIGPVKRLEMATLWSDFAVRKLPGDSTSERREEARKAAREKWLSKPAVVVVSQVLDDDPVRREEDYAAVACAMQNIQLAGWALGVGSQWSTNPATRDPTVLETLGVPSGESVVGFLFMGYAATVPDTRRRPLTEVLRRTA